MSGGAANRMLVLADSVGIESGESDGVQTDTFIPTQANQAQRCCDVCFGTGMEVVQGKGARRCACRGLELRQRLLAEVGIPKRHEASSFASYQPAKDNGSQMRAYSLAYRLVREYPAVERGLLFAGPVGVGKTHLAVSILKGLIEKGTRCQFYDYGSLLKQIQESYNPVSQTSEAGVIARICEADCLVLDELGASRPTQWALETMTHVIGRRYNDKRLTIFTTNYLDGRQNPTAETLEERIGVRLRSRLYEMCRTVFVEGEDYRLRFDNRC